jgi:predicted O-methyltransferase YrrM
MTLQINDAAQTIYAHCCAVNPDLPKILKRVRSRVPALKREIAIYQAAALYTIVRPLRGQGARILEIGTAWGYSAAVMAEAAPDAQIVTLNPLVEEAAIAQEHLRHYPNVEVRMQKSWDYLKAYTGAPFDFIFVDGDHKRVRLDLPWWDRLKVGGGILFHDYAPEGTYRACPPVYNALNDFASTLGHEFDYLIVDDGGVGMAGFIKEQAMSAKQVAGERAYDLGQAAAASVLSFNHLSELYNLGKLIRERGGSIVECGCMNGGSAAAIYAGARKSVKEQRPLHLFDTFYGIPKPSEHDEPKAHAKWEAHNLEAVPMDERGWCMGDQAALAEVMRALKIPAKAYTVYAGLFENQFPNFEPQPISFLHVDATLYDSTLQALHFFYPKVAPGGIVTISALGHWAGVQAATNDYFESIGAYPAVQMKFIDQINVWFVKP